MTLGAPRTSLARWVVAALVVGLAVAALAAWLLWTTGDDGTDAADDRATGDTQADRTDVTATADGECRWDTETLIVGGMTVPADCEHGPDEVDDGRLSGWARTRQGAAYAATGLKIATGALAGPDVYRPTIEEQTYGPDSERQALLDDVEREYAELQAEYQLDGGPFEGTWPRGQIEDYRIEAYSEDKATVWLLGSADERHIADRMDLRWIDGDWQASVETKRRWRKHMDRNPVPERFEDFGGS